MLLLATAAPAVAEVSRDLRWLLDLFVTSVIVATVAAVAAVVGVDMDFLLQSVVDVCFLLEGFATLAASVGFD